MLRIASMTKMITTAAALQLWEQGRYEQVTGMPNVLSGPDAAFTAQWPGLRGGQHRRCGL
jgi:hypothetical protein